MKPFFTTLALLALISSPAFAQKKKTVVKTTTTTTTSAPASSAPVYSYNGGSSTHSSGSPAFSVDFGIGTMISKFHFGVGLRADFPVTIDGNAFTFGGQTGFYLGPSDPSTWVIPILATGVYHFRNSNSLKPYIGLGMGISIAHLSFSNGFGVGASASSTDFAIIAKPGMDFGDGEKYYFELPIGTVASNFMILPSVGMHF